MTRPIKFRAKDIKTDEWQYGSLLKGLNDTYWIDIVEQFDGNAGIFQEQVDPETIGQFTGLVDKNGTPIYEGDILHWSAVHDDPVIVEVNQGNFQVIFEWGGWHLDLPAGVAVPYRNSLWKLIDNMETENDDTFEVVGNIYETPELLEAKL